MDNVWMAALLGLVEGLTEFLPVSSTGHLILVGDALGLYGSRVATFEIVIQFGAILAVLLLYWGRFWGLLRSRPHRAFSGLRGIALLMVTTLPGALLGLAASSCIKSLFSPSCVMVSLGVGALCMLLAEWWVARHQPARAHAPSGLDELTFRQALGVGCFQCLALWPGFSRSAATIMGGMLLGLRRELAAEYSFIAAVPLIVGAAGYDLLKSLPLFSLADLPFFAVGTALAFVSAVAAIKTFIRLLGRVTLRPFALYRLLLIVPVYWFLVR
ncbi:MAG: undecaprenyl-diphosphate phosphatase [Desulfovibrionaceae bacterium]|nr:undecaprenyl-diphosphate phosphatase [Desulfovibrionaceae bacterium]